MVVDKDETVLVLSKYERDNLVALLRCINGEPFGPGVLANGDWAGQIYHRLAPHGYNANDHNPNQTPDAMVRSLRATWGLDKPPRK